jgi:hypothetical protein
MEPWVEEIVRNFSVNLRTVDQEIGKKYEIPHEFQTINIDCDEEKDEEKDEENGHEDSDQESKMSGESDQDNIFKPGVQRSEKSDQKITFRQKMKYLIRFAIKNHTLLPAFQYEGISYKYSPKLIERVVEFFSRGDQSREEANFFRKEILRDFNLTLSPKLMRELYNQADLRNVDHMTKAELRQFFDYVIEHPYEDIGQVAKRFNYTREKTKRIWRRYIYTFIRKGRPLIRPEDFDFIRLDLLQLGPKRR